MKKFLATLVLFFMLIACGPTKQTTNTSTDTYGYTKIYYEMNAVITMTQVDSMITVDKLAPLDEWYSNTNGNKNTLLIQFFYIKSLEQNNEIIYTLTQTKVDTIFKCTKRITKEVK